MKTKRRILFSLLAVLILAAIAACMMVIGRGHTVYLDNKTVEDYQGQEYKAYERIVVTVGGGKPSKLGKRERGEAIWIGQNFKMTLEITEKKGDDPVVKEAWYSEFVPAVPDAPVEEDPTLDDGFGLEGDMGLEGGPAAGGI